MAIPVTLRSQKGSELTIAEGDNNFSNLARSATEALEGNIQIATQAEVNGLTNDTKAIVPATLEETVTNIINDNLTSLTADVLFDSPAGTTGTFNILDKSSYVLIEVEALTDLSDWYTTFQISNSSIVIGREYSVLRGNTSSSGTQFSRIRFNSDTSMTLINTASISITRVTGYK